MPAEMDRPGWAEEEFQRLLWDPTAWWDKAEDLLRAVDALRPNVERYWQLHVAGNPPGKRLHDVHGTYFMCVGFVLENLCKAAIVHQRLREGVSTDVRRLPPFLNNHILMDLLGEIGVTVPEGYARGVIERVTRAVLWSGHYPVPSEASELTRGRRLGILMDMYCADDLDALRQLVDFTRGHVAKILGIDDAALGNIEGGSRRADQS